MDLFSDIPPEDLKVFTEEAEEQLQLLDESIIRMESEGTDPLLIQEIFIQEIFRAAHTLKGSSAMLGHQLMSQLAHAMETVLDRVRKGTLPITTPVIDALLLGLDGLRTMKDDLTAYRESVLDIGPSVAKLELVTEEHEGDQPSALGATETAATLTLDGAAMSQLRTALAAGQSAYLLNVTLSPETALLAVRCFQALTQAASVGDVIASLPSLQDIEQERAGLELQIILASPQNAGGITRAVESAPDVESVGVEPYRLEEAEAVPVKEGPAVESDTSKPGASAQTVRIDVERLDSLMNTVGELVIDRTRMGQINKAFAARYQDDEWVEALGTTSSHIARLIGELQEEIMRVRMLPIGSVFSGFPRMIRDLAKRFDKRLDFQMEGQETEIDRTVVEHIRDPLVHLLRNAVDHGIETPAVRRAAGKPEKGTLRLSARHEQSLIAIAVEDDGQGIDAAKIRDSSVKKGLVSAVAVARMSDAEALNLIFMAGLSTHEQATDVSGRGVGMDIVKTNIESVHGFVSLDTKVGQGTKFTLKLPLTLATTHSLLVTSRGSLFAVPLVYVLQALEIAPEGVHIVGGMEVMSHRGSVLPLLQLSTLLGSRRAAEANGHKRYAVVVRFGERTLGLVVDGLMEP